jgi:hypothetical protein
MTKPLEPEWTPEQVIKVRKVYRQGGTIDDVIRLFNSTLSYEATRKRALVFGMRFRAIKTSHEGNSKSVTGGTHDNHSL